jgi:L-iditol 2-dehydrogenase
MANKMKVAIMTANNKIEFTERPIPVPASNEVLVKLEYVGVCGSDLHYFETGRIGNFIVKPPFVLGHEASGTIVSVGSHVKDLAVGDRVAMEPGKTCGHCEFCKTGRYNLCPDVVFFATPPVDGVFQEYVAHEADLCFKLPDNVSTMEGALIEPLAVGFYAAHQADAHVGQSAIVFGAGCIGLVTVLALKARGLSDIYIVDTIDSRLETARKLGAIPINAVKADIIEQAAKATGGKGFDLAFEAAGTEITTSNAINVVKKGATIALIGYGKSGYMNLPTSMMIDKELTIKTIFRYRHIYPMAIEAVASGNIDVKQIVNKEFAFDDLQNALDSCIADKAAIVKAVIKM